VVGSVVGDLILMTLSAFGLALAAQALGSLFLAVKLAGAAYLLYLGSRYWTAKVDDAPTAPPADARQSFVTQLAITLGNPKAVVFFVALLPNVVDLKRLDLSGYLALSAATLVLIPAVELSYAAGASRFQGALTSPKARTRLNRSAAVLMTGAGIGVALT
jgi:threonine/homoserine/homoserine lactone efflux protein